MKLLKLLWALLGDDRLGLILCGICLAGALADFKAGNGGGAALGLAFAVMIGVFAWLGVGVGKAVKA